MSKWLTWKAPIFSLPPKSEPPKPPKPTPESPDEPNRGGFGGVADGEKGSAIFSYVPRDEPPEPPKPTPLPGSVGFGGASLGVSKKIEAAADGIRIFTSSPRDEPPEPPKPIEEGPEGGFGGFGGAILGESRKIERARAALDRAGVRFLTVGGERVAGVWSDRDGERVREALREAGAGALPVRYLDGPGVPDRWKGRLAPGEPVPLNVLEAMMQATGEPWRVRDEMVVAMRWRPERPKR